MSRKYVLFVTLLAAVAASLTACRTDNGSGDDSDSGITGDAPDGTGCAALTPRSEAVESFVMPQGYEARMASIIDGAQTSLDIQMYLWTSTSLANKVVAAKNRGVAVRVLLDPDHEGNDNVKPIFTSARASSCDSRAAACCRVSPFSMNPAGTVQ